MQRGEGEHLRLSEESVDPNGEYPELFLKTDDTQRAFIGHRDCCYLNHCKGCYCKCTEEEGQQLSSGPGEVQMVQLFGRAKSEEVTMFSESCYSCPKLFVIHMY